MMIYRYANYYNNLRLEFDLHSKLRLLKQSDIYLVPSWRII